MRRSSVSQGFHAQRERRRCRRLETRTCPRRRLRVAAGNEVSRIGVLLLALASPAFAQEEAAKPKVLVSPFGVEIFARLIDQLGMQPITSLDQLDDKVPISKCVVIVFGSTKPLDDLRLHEPVLRRADNGLGLDYLTNKGAAAS